MEIDKTLVRFILNHGECLDWSLQGFGMLRLYLDDEERFRLHVWDSHYTVPGVSVMHDHPWGFLSYVVAGRIDNNRFIPHPREGAMYLCQTVKCGEGGGLAGVPSRRRMKVHPAETYLPGETYTQFAHEVHISAPQDGTVTIVKRTFERDRDHAHVFWPDGTEWVSAEPRPATKEEVRKVCLNALEKWF